MLLAHKVEYIFEGLDTRYYKSSEVFDVFTSRFVLDHTEDFR